MDLYWGDVITNCPKLKDIYLYAENPENIAFGIFEKLDNMSEIVLHVPCFCAKKYRDAYSGDTRSPIPVISVHSVGNLQYRRQS